jgi:CheY-like chemotaxis protein
MVVLLVEDDVVVRLTLSAFLEETGLEILEASDADEALAILADPAQCIDILVTDLDLGPGDDGLILAAKARLCLPHLQVIYATGSPERFTGYGFSPWEQVFLKPFSPAALATAVSALAGPVRLRRCNQPWLVREVSATSL